MLAPTPFSARPLPAATSAKTTLSKVARVTSSVTRFPRWLTVACVIVAVLVLLPIAVTVVQALQGGFSAVGDALRAPSSLTLLKNTALIALIAVPVAGVLGLAGAWFVERTQLPLRRLWAILLVAPLTVPPFVTSYSWASLGNPLQGTVGAAGIVAFTYFPIVYLLAAVALRGLDPALEETAQSLGLGTRAVFARVILPQLRPALLGGLLLVALDTFIEFDAFVALKVRTFSSDIYSQYQLGFSASGAAALSAFSLVLCLVVLFGEARLRGNANYTRVSQGARRVAPRYALGRATVPVLAGFVALVGVSLGIPIGELVHWLASSSSAAFDAASANLQYLGPATLTSVLLGVSASVLAVVLALPVAVLAVRHRGPGVTALERSVYLSFALPDLVAAIALAYAASHVANFLYGSFVLLVFAEAVLFLPFAVVALRATIGQIEPALEDSARSLGAGPVAAFFRVTAPLARPGFLAAGVLVFAFTLGDLGTAQVLLPLDRYTLGTEFQANSSSVAFAAAAPFAAVLIGLALVAAYVVMTRFGEVRALGERAPGGGRLRRPRAGRGVVASEE
jgi:iron(III) transport system permease protein